MVVVAVAQRQCRRWEDESVVAVVQVGMECGWFHTHTHTHIHIYLVLGSGTTKRKGGSKLYAICIYVYIYVYRTTIRYMTCKIEKKMFCSKKRRGEHMVRAMDAPPLASVGFHHSQVPGRTSIQPAGDIVPFCYSVAV
jgi:hypothetical protein